MTADTKDIFDLLTESTTERIREAIEPIRRELYEAVEQALRRAVERVFRPAQPGPGGPTDRNGEPHSVPMQHHHPGC